ncbi:AraC-like ligand binding domain-containing protein [Myroides marinus]|uniref:AraC-like ligand binding domain-containing protein n=1 Tax=Myroides marinus TaxID=703342 RepID=A0A1H6XNP7_9FLAO|nr:helix-turn-helix domain-containing protein [Myroides marinus]KUF44505.1 AraC family transcriptional regulator [Myroides marinus]MDM1355466.1 helix-turn-helix domain-containing protein [Myroides marinus]MDM1376561.1 helix-turn-helix domain-containing protein [Myroides marinus]SEJ26175.1 AraC-like ligand binding domain-containing protein [Myroides marinus]
MARENIYQPFEVFYERVDCCPLQNRLFNFFEFVFVISGEGYHIVNESKNSLKEGDLYLITPEDTHSFDLTSLSEFLVIRINTEYINQYNGINHLESVLYYASHLATSIITDSEDKELVKQLALCLVQTTQHPKTYNCDLQRQYINAMMIIATRNLTSYTPQQLESKDERILEIVAYIQQNIYNLKQLTAQVIGDRFGLAPSYIGSYFFNQCGETMQQYITSYRLKLLKHRLLFSDYRIGEIAQEFYFTDESHANKFFKKHEGLSMSAFRKAQRKL